MHPFLVKFALILPTVLMVSTQMLPPWIYDTVPRLVQSAGYPVEKHQVLTADGYELQMHRIPSGKQLRRSKSRGKGKRAVLLVHGLMGCSDNFVLMGPNRSLGYMLADAGYDVWLGNARGTQYSSHKQRPKDEASFWDFSFHEIGILDLPAMIDHILVATGQPKVLYVGHSMGASGSFAMLSQRPEYNDKVVASVELAPAVYMDHLKGLAKVLMETLNITVLYVGHSMGATGFIAMLSQRPEYNVKVVASVELAPAVYMDHLKGLAKVSMETLNITNKMRSEGIHHLTLNRDAADFLARVCLARTREDDVCMRAAFLLTGEDYEQNDWEISPTLPARIQPSSLRTIEHYLKIAISGVFTTFEGGFKGPVVPYNLANVKVPVTLLYGENDQVTTKSNILRLAEQLNSSGVLEHVRPATRWSKFNHMDFVFAKDLGRLVNRRLVLDIAALFHKYAPTL